MQPVLRVVGSLHHSSQALLRRIRPGSGGLPRPPRKRSAGVYQTPDQDNDDADVVRNIGGSTRPNTNDNREYADESTEQRQGLRDKTNFPRPR